MNAPQPDSISSGQGAMSENSSRDGGQLGFDLVSLTTSAAQLRSEQIAFARVGQTQPGMLADTGEQELTYAAFHALVKRYTGALQRFGLKPGDRILITGCLSPRSVAAVIASLATGIDTALAGLHLDSDEIAAFARHTGAVAIVTEAGASDNAVVQQIWTAAAQCDAIRLVISLADRAADGTVPMKATGDSTARLPRLQDAARIITRAMDGAPVTHIQETLIAAGLDFIAKSKLSAGAPILSTIIPASFAGLVCGPIAGLLTGAPTLLHAPFDSRQLISRIQRDRPVQLIVPSAISRHIETSGFCDREHLAALVLLSRFEASPATLSAPAIPAMDAAGVTISDLIAFDELTVVAQARGPDGAPAQPLEQNHMLPIGGRQVIAVRAVKHLLENNGIRSTTIAFDGLAVSKMNWKFYDAAE